MSADAVTSNQSAVGSTPTAVGARAATVENLKILNSPQEGGSKKEYEDFLDKIRTHVTIRWEHGKDIGELVKDGKEPDIGEPDDITMDDSKSFLKMRRWQFLVDRYSLRLVALEENKTSLFALVMDAVSKITKAKLKSKIGFSDAEGK